MLLLAFLLCLVGVAPLFLFSTIIPVLAKCIFGVSCFTVWLCCYIKVYGTVNTAVPSGDTLVTHQMLFQC